MRECCKNCKYLTSRDIMMFCCINCKPIHFPKIQGGSKKCECYAKYNKENKKIPYPKKEDKKDGTI